MSKQMSAVILWDDGTYEIEDVYDESVDVTQHTSGWDIVNGKVRNCEIYYCPKGTEKYYLRKLVKQQIDEKEKLIRQLTEKKYQLMDTFEDILKE